jgi:hypothetical protein
MAALNDPSPLPQNTFHSLFGPIAYHFFPDGCPIHSDNDGLPGESHFLRRIWPVYTQRSIVTAAKAAQSLTELRTYGTQQGFAAEELVAVAFIATQFLPRALTTVHSPLLETPTKHFSSLIRCLLPRSSDENVNDGEKENTEEEVSISNAWRLVVRRLVAAVSFQSPGHRASTTERIARQCVVRCITLRIRYFPEPLISPVIISYILQWLGDSAEHSDATTAWDVLRFLWTHHLHRPQQPLPPYRWQQIRTLHQKLLNPPSHTSSLSSRPWKAICTAMADLLDLPNNMSGAASTTPRWTHFPDAAWERDFQQHVTTTRPSLELTRGDEDGTMNQPRKRPCASPRRNLHPILHHIRSRQGNAVADDSPTFPPGWIGFVSTMEASDVLLDSFFQHISSFYSRSPGNNAPSLHPFRRVLSMLEHKLYEQWNDSAVPSSNPDYPTTDSDEKKSCPPNRQKLLRGVLTLAQTTNALPGAIERFMIQTVVPQVDFASTVDDDDYALLHILAFIEPPHQDTDSKALSDVASVVGRNGTRLVSLLCTLEKWFCDGTNDLRYALVSITLTQWICRWLVLDWSADPANRDDEMCAEILDQWKMQTLHGLCHWVDDLLLKGFLSSRGDGIELLQGAAIDFYLSIGNELAKHDSPSHRNTGVLFGPSASLLYRIFLSASVVHMDRVCYLMVLYKDIYQNWKRKYVGTDKTKTEPSMGDETFTAGIAQIQEYNGVIYDFCSLLWTCTSFPNPNTAAGDVAESRPKSALFQSFRPSTQACLHDTATWESTNRLGASSFPISSALSLSHGAAFVGYASDFLKFYYNSSMDTVTVFGKDGGTPKLSPNIIQGALKVQYLEYLKARDLSGIHTLLCTFIRSLASTPHKV